MKLVPAPSRELTAIVPPIAIVMSWLILGEIPGMLAVLGGALCLVGVYIARRPAKGSV